MIGLHSGVPLVSGTVVYATSFYAGDSCAIAKICFPPQTQQLAIALGLPQHSRQTYTIADILDKAK